MKKMKRVLGALLAASMVFSGSVVGFAEEAAEEETVTIGMACINLSDAGLVLIQKGAELAAEDYNCELIWKACDGSIDTQIDQIRGFIQQGVDVIWVDSYDVAGVVDVVNEATEAGIIVVTAGSKVDANDNYNLIYPDYADSLFAGTVVGKYYEEQEGTVALVVATPGSRISEDRQAGFTDGLSKYPNLKLVTGAGEWDANTSMTVAEDLCRSNDDLLHMHVIASGMSFGAYEGVKNVGKDITISTNDGDPTSLDHMEAGDYMLDNVVGNERLGYWDIVVCRHLADGMEMARDQFLPTYKVAGEEMMQFIEENGLTEIDGNTYEVVSIEEARKIVDSSSYREEFNRDFVPAK